MYQIQVGKEIITLTEEEINSFEFATPQDYHYTPSPEERMDSFHQSIFGSFL